MQFLRAFYFLMRTFSREFSVPFQCLGSSQTFNAPGICNTSQSDNANIRTRSDLFMMGRPSEESGGAERPRGTLQIPQMIEKYSFNAAIGINNVGNAFTPYGSCDPLALASLGVGMYQAGTKKDADILLVSYCVPFINVSIY